MNNYMVIVRLPNVLNEEFINLIPQQRSHVDILMHNGVILFYALAKDRSRLWTTIVAESEYDVMAIVDAFPLRTFMKAEVVELQFHNTPALLLPQMSLN